jgi:hypothetical protein
VARSFNPMLESSGELTRNFNRPARGSFADGLAHHIRAGGNADERAALERIDKAAERLRTRAHTRIAAASARELEPAKLTEYRKRSPMAAATPSGESRANAVPLSPRDKDEADKRAEHNVKARAEQRRAEADDQIGSLRGLHLQKPFLKMRDRQEREGRGGNARPPQGRDERE